MLFVVYAIASSMIPCPIRCPLFPYTTLFRSLLPVGIDCPRGVRARRCRRGPAACRVRGGMEEVRAALGRSEEHTSELQSLRHLVCRLLLEKKKKIIITKCTYACDKHRTALNV